MNDGSEARELAESNAFMLQRLQKNLALAKAEANDAYRQLSEAWKALEYFSGMSAMEAIKEHQFVIEEER